MELFDSHAHLNDEKFNQDRDSIIEQIKESGVTKLISAGYSLESSISAKELADKYDFIYTTVGISPNDIPQTEEELWIMLDKMEEMAKQSKKIVAIGEIGLDYYWNQENKDLVHVNNTINKVLKGYEDVLTNPDCNKGQLSYFKNLDKITNGYKGGQMIVLAARPGCGKTSFAMNIVCNIARNEPDKVVAVFNLEMSISELTQRILLTMASVPHESVVSGASADEFKRLWGAKKILEKSNIYIDDTANTTPEQIMSKCRRLKQMKKRLDFVVIDYLQLLKAHTSRQSIQQEVTEISRSLKIMAKELDVPVFALSQTSRDLEKRDDGDPKMSDLRESGAIEQDADQVYFLVKQKLGEGSVEDIINLHIVKHRSGPCATISFRWQGSMVKFTPLSFEETRNLKQQKSTVEQAVAASKNAEDSNEDSKKTDNPEDIDYKVDDEDKTPPPFTGETTIIYNENEGSNYSLGDEPNWGAEYDKATNVSNINIPTEEEE